jgi:hypothetical protein
MYEQWIELAFELAKQSPTIFLLGLAVYEFRRREMEAVKKLEKGTKDHAKELKLTNEAHSVEVKKMHEDWREESNETANTLDLLANALDKKK